MFLLEYLGFRLVVTVLKPGSHNVCAYERGFYTLTSFWRFLHAPLQHRTQILVPMLCLLYLSRLLSWNGVNAALSLSIRGAVTRRRFAERFRNHLGTVLLRSTLGFQTEDVSPRTLSLDLCIVGVAPHGFARGCDFLRYLLCGRYHIRVKISDVMCDYAGNPKMSTL